MELALVTGARPLFCSDLAIVLLAAGEWRFKLDGISDSEIHVVSLSPLSTVIIEKLEHNHNLMVLVPTVVQCRFSKKGSEKHINIWAEKIENGNRHSINAKEAS